MNRGLLYKSLRENWPVTLGYGLLLALVETVISFIAPRVQTGMFTMIMKMDFARGMLSALLGTPVSGEMGAQLLQAIPWVHPLVLLIVFAHEITICTRLPAGEIDRGTIDLLLGLPVSRGQVYAIHALVWAASGAVLLLMGLGGNWLGTHFAHAAMASPARLAITLVNAWCLYFAIGCFTLLVASVGERRGRAVGTAIAVVVTSFLLNFLAEFWLPAKNLNFLSVLYYYRPFFILQAARWPLRDLAVLLAAGATCLAVGGTVFRKRDIHTL
jgi:ABC-type transport system involved in multi-copper enzyme maturation permease subunit